MRRVYIDWLRGVAVLCMIEWHVLDAWSLRAGRDTPAWMVVQTIGGFAAPLFLFLAGVAVPLAIAAHERRGATVRDAAWSLQKRGWQVFGIAILFKLQSFLLNPNAEWLYLFKPDILNILGLGLAATAWGSGRVLGSKRRYWWLLAAAVTVVILTPLSKSWWWPTLLPPRLEAYIRPVGTLGVFSLFPWLAYVPFGGFIGALLKDAQDDARERALLLKIAAVAGAVVVAGVAARAWLLPYPDVLRTSITAAAMAAALLVSRWVVGVQPAILTAPAVLMGQTSLFVYLVHIELAYGVWSLPLHSALPLPWSLAGFAAMVVAMYYAARWWKARPAKTSWIPERLQVHP